MFSFKFFCSVFCFKSSKYFERQIPTSPVWAREHYQQGNNSFKVDLLKKENCNEQYDNSVIISQSNYNRAMPKISHLRDASSDDEDDDDEDEDNEFEQLQIARDAYYKSRISQFKKPALVEKKLEQISLPEHIRTNNKIIDFVITCFYEWITNNTKDYLENDTTTTTTTSPAQIDPHKYQQLTNKLDIEDMTSSDSSRAEKKIPTMDELKETKEKRQYELKVKEFFFGKDDPSNEV